MIAKQILLGDRRHPTFYDSVTIDYGFQHHHLSLFQERLPNIRAKKQRRHTYQNQFGGRRTQAPLAYRFIQEFANIPDPKTLSQAISEAIASKYIVCVEEGRLHTDPAQRKPTSYAVRWLGDHPSLEGGPTYPAGDRFKIPSGGPVQ